MPLASIASRAARTRSTARSKSNSGSSASPEESSIESPAIPVAAASVTFSATRGGLHRVATLEVGVDRDVHGVRDGAQVVERLVERDLVVGAPQRPCHPAAGRRQRREAHLLEDPRGAGVPGVGHDEAALGVQAVELGDPVSWRVHAPNLSPGTAGDVEPEQEEREQRAGHQPGGVAPRPELGLVVDAAGDQVVGGDGERVGADPVLAGARAASSGRWPSARRAGCRGSARCCPTPAGRPRPRPCDRRRSRSGGRARCRRSRPARRPRACRPDPAADTKSRFAPSTSRRLTSWSPVGDQASDASSGMSVGCVLTSPVRYGEGRQLVARHEVDGAAVRAPGRPADRLRRRVRGGDDLAGPDVDDGELLAVREHHACCPGRTRRRGRRRRPPARAPHR